MDAAPERSALTKGHAFLLALDALARKNQRPTRLAGRVCIAVMSDEGVRYWQALLGPRLQSGFTDGVPSDTRALLALTAAEAEALLQTGGFPADHGARVGGDQTFLSDFFREFVSFQNPLDIRACASAGRGGRSRRRRRR